MFLMADLTAVGAHSLGNGRQRPSLRLTGPPQKSPARVLGSTAGQTGALGRGAIKRAMTVLVGALALRGNPRKLLMRRR
jgi:hypothetical protein